MFRMGKQFLLNMWHPSCNYKPNAKACNVGFQLYNIVDVSVISRGIESVFNAYDIIVLIIFRLDFISKWI